MGRHGWVRCSAWIWPFSSTHRTTACSGGSRYKPTTSTNSSVGYLYDVNKALPDVLADGTYTYVYGVGLTYAVDGSGNLEVYHTDAFGVPTPCMGQHQSNTPDR